MRRLFCIALLPLLFACGKGESESLDDGGGRVVPPPDDAGTGGDCGPQIFDWGCTDPCGLGCPSPVCIDGVWQSPPSNGVDCLFDSGADACSVAVPIICPVDTTCTGRWAEPVCSGGQWSCQWNGECLDGGPIDAGERRFACGDTACYPATTYCQINTGGPVLDDGGTPSSSSCAPLPSTCIAAHATCACVQALQGVSPGCDCLESNGDVIVTCQVP